MRRFRPVDTRSMRFFCFRCHGPGHMEIGCNNPIRCGRCAGPHFTTDDCEEPVKCPNCLLEHEAWSNKCDAPALKEMDKECNTWYKSGPTWLPKSQQATRSSGGGRVTLGQVGDSALSLSHKDNRPYVTQKAVPQKRKPSIQSEKELEEGGGKFVRGEDSRVRPQSLQETVPVSQVTSVPQFAAPPPSVACSSRSPLATDPATNAVSAVPFVWNTSNFDFGSPPTGLTVNNPLTLTASDTSLTPPLYRASGKSVIFGASRQSRGQTNMSSFLTKLGKSPVSNQDLTSQERSSQGLSGQGPSDQDLSNQDLSWVDKMTEVKG